MKRLGFMVLLAAVAPLIKCAGGSGRGKFEVQLALSFLGWGQHPPPPPLPLLPNGDLVEKIWLFCLQDMAGTEETLSNAQSLVSGVLTRKNDVKTSLFLELLALLPPDKKRIALQCMSANYLHLDVPLPPEHNNRLQSSTYPEYLGLWWLLLGSPSPRRHLAEHPFAATAPAISPRALLVLDSAEAAVPRPETAEMSSTPARPPHYEPSYLHGHPLASKPQGLHAPVLLSEKQGCSNIKLVLITVVLTAILTFAVVFAIFCCYRCNKSKVSVAERPLLHLQLADFPGSSPESHVLAGSTYKDTRGGGSFKTGLNLCSCFSCFRSSSNDTTTHGQVPCSTLEENTDTSDAMKSKNLPPPPPPPPPPPMPPPTKRAAPSRPRLPNSEAGPGAFPRASCPSPLGLNHSGELVSGKQLSGEAEAEASARRAKLKPFFWDKVLAHPDQSMAWHQIKSGSFHVNEDMIEQLFGYSAGDRNEGKDKELAIAYPSSQHISLLDVKKSCNLAVVFKAMNIKIEDIQNALIEGNELPRMLVETILRMAPTEEEELKLRLYDGDYSQLGLAEQVLKALIDIPFAFQRINALLFMSSFQEDASSLRESFTQVEVACKELRNRLFLKLLEAVLKTGNRLNDGTLRGGAQAFKLDTLLKLSDVKGTDGKTTLLHFVVQEIIRSEGGREARTPIESGRTCCYSELGIKVVSGLSSDMENVKRVAGLDADTLASGVLTLSHKLLKTREFLDSGMTSVGDEEGDPGFYCSLKRFVQDAEAEINFLVGEEKRVRLLVESTIRYFHGDAAAKGEGFRLFTVVRDFLVMLDKACKEVGGRALPQHKTAKKRSNTKDTCAEIHPQEQQFPQVNLDSGKKNSQEEIKHEQHSSSEL